MKLGHPFSAVRRDMFVVNAIAIDQSSVGAACPMSPLTGLGNYAFAILQTFRTYGADDTLEAQLHQTRTLGAHLLASTLHHLLAA